MWDEDEWREERNRLMVEWETKRQVYQPEAIPFFPPSPPPSIVRLRNRQLQLVVRLLHSTLTPNGSSSPPDSLANAATPTHHGWHVDGQRNECIVGTAVMVVSESNVRPTSIAFRCAVEEPTLYEDQKGLQAIYGFGESSVLVEPLGEVQLRPQRCLVYPNVFEHRLSEAELVDAGAGGHRTVLLLHLVDPTQRVLSTSFVPPQQAEWWDRQLDEAAAPFIPILALQHVISDYAQPTLRSEEAWKHREKAMKERAVYQAKATQVMYQRPVRYF